MSSFLRRRKEAPSITQRDSSSSIKKQLPISIPLPILILSSIILIPYFLSLIHLSPFSILLSFPFIILIWIASIPASLLFAAYLADSKSCHYTSNSSSNSHLNPINLPSRPFSHLVSTSLRTPIHPSSTAVSQSADQLISLILRDFIQKWHIPLLYGNATVLPPQSNDTSSLQPHELFSLATEKSIRHALSSGIERAAKLDIPTLGIGQILPTITNHLERFRIAEMDLNQLGEAENYGSGPVGGKKDAGGGGGGRKAALSTSGSSEEVDLFLAAKYQSSSVKLHPAVSNVSSPDSKPSELEHLRKLATRALNYVLPPDELQSRAVFTTVREVVACTVLMPVVDMLSDPDFWNGILDQKTGAAIQEQKLVQQLRQALDRQGSSDSPSSTNPQRTATSTLGSLTSFGLSSTSSQSSSESKVNKSHHSFAAFLKNIEDIDSILEARRSRNDVSMQIRKTKSALASVTSNDPEAAERKTGLVKYLEKLHLALSVAEKKVEELSVGHKQAVKNSEFALPTSPSRSNSSSHQTTLDQVLHNTSTLSYWMEHMDRRKRSELIQFWLAVESFKDPLESVESESEEIESSFSGMNPDPSTVQTLKEDLKLFTEVYYPSRSLNIKPTYISTAEAFINSGSLTPSARQVQKVRESVLKAQRQVFKEMLEDDWPIFKNGDLFFKAQDDLARENNNVRSPESTIHSRVSSTSGTGAGSISSAGFFNASSSASRSHSTSQTSGSSTPFKELPQHPMTRSNSDHADLFGRESPPLTGPGGRSFFSSTSNSTAKPLFGEDEASNKVSSGLVSPKVDSMNDNFHFLVGSTKGSRKGADGRAPLFDTDPLFEDVEEEDENGLFGGTSSSSKNHSRESEYVKVEIEMMDAVTSILDDDESRKKVEKAGKRKASLNGESGSDSTPKLGKSTAARDLRPAFKKAGTNNTLSNSVEDVRKFSSKGIFGDDVDPVDERSVTPGTPTSISKPGSELRQRRESISSSEEDSIANSSIDRQEVISSPGTLDLSSEISRLSIKLEKLLPQEEILAALMRKAELTGAKDKELRLLTKSKSAIGREIKELKWQVENLKKQYEEQKLRSGRTRVRIKNSTIGHDPDGKEFATYLIEVTQLSATSSVDAETTPSSGWIVGRRYSEFFALHQRLKEKFQEVRALESDFPGRRLVGLVNAPFVDSRRASLDKYLQLLAKIPRVIESVELSLFLSKNHATSSLANGSLDFAANALANSDDKTISNSKGNAPQSSISAETAYPGQGLVKTLFRGMSGVAEGLDGLIFGQSMFEVVHQRLLAQSRSSLSSSDPNLSISTLDPINVGQAMQGASLAEVKEAAAAGTTYFTEPICDLVSEIFELKRENNWLRRQAIVIILQQLLGGTIERKLRETISNALSPTPLLSYIASLQNGLWPNGELKEPSKPRTSKEKAELRESANKKLSTFIPDVASNFIGRQNARRGARRLFSVLQNRRLNRHLIYIIIDQVFDELFPLREGDDLASI